MQEKSGARIQLPKVDESQAPADEDDDPTVDVTVEGNYHSVEFARREIAKIAGERAASVSHKLRGVPPVFHPFIAGAQNSRASTME